MMHKIEKKVQLSESVFQLQVHAPLIAEERRQGQFIILQTFDESERMPLTIADASKEQGWIMLICQVVGKSTQQLATLEEGDSIAHLVGPLGSPTHIEHFGTVVCVGGGIGVAPLHPIAKAMKEAGNRVLGILGARSGDLVILEENMKKIADELIVCTDDGSYGRKCLVTGPLEELCKREPAPDLVVAVGPPVMMKFCAETTRPFGIKTIVSLNTIMVDGTGMCGGCRVTVGGETKFVCVDGPEFDGHKVDFDNMMHRLDTYKKREEREHHECQLKQDR